MANFLNFRDMIDGGGAGQSGNRFSGGGLLSEIGNTFFQPAGSRARQAESSMTNIPPSVSTQIPDNNRKEMVSNNQIPKKPLSDSLQNKSGFSFESFLDNLPDIDAQRPLGELQQAYQRNLSVVQEDYDRFIKGLGSNTKDVNPDTLQRAFQLWRTQYK